MTEPVVEDPPIVGLVTLAELHLAIHQVTVVDTANYNSALQSIALASGAVQAYCERLDVPWTNATAPDAVRLVTCRLAARLFTNPDQRVSYTGPEGLSYSGGPVRLFTDDERATLDLFRSQARGVGMIRTAVAPWMTNPPAAVTP
jgi:hypothetical protein